MLDQFKKRLTSLVGVNQDAEEAKIASGQVKTSLILEKQI